MKSFSIVLSLLFFCFLVRRSLSFKEIDECETSKNNSEYELAIPTEEIGSGNKRNIWVFLWGGGVLDSEANE